MIGKNGLENQGEIRCMLETSQERMELLKARIDIKKIEELYLRSNNIKILAPLFLTIGEPKTQML